MKKKMILLVCVPLLAAYTFIDFQDIFDYYYPQPKVPKEYRDYKLLSDEPETDNYKITYLKEGSLTSMYTLENDIIIEVVNDIHNGYICFYHRIDQNGQLVRSYKQPDEIYISVPGYLLGSEVWSSWPTSGDSTLYPYIKIPHKLGKREFSDYYQKADIVYHLDSNYVLLIEGKWYSVKTDFEVEFGTKMPGDIIYFDNSYLTFNEYPAYNEGIRLNYFERIKTYYHFWRSFNLNLGSPTGGTGRQARWDGSGYFELELGGCNIPFIYYMEEYDDPRSYKANMELYKTTKFAIINSNYYTYLIRRK